MNDITVLVPGGLHDHAIERIAHNFDLRRVERGEASLLTDDTLRAVRGIASFGRINADFIDALPNLEIIANFGVGYDAVDAKHAAQKGVMVTNTPDVLTEEVADTAVGLLINTVRELPQAEAWLRAGRWVSEGNYRFSGASLRGRSIGIFGMGRIGQAIARRLEAFALPISYHNRRPIEGCPYVWYATLKELAAAVDTLICVAPGGAETEKAINAEVLAALGPDGVLVNIGRGSTVDEEALIAALHNGTILAAGLDVFRDEPHVPQGLLDAENAVLLPHVGSASVHTRRAMADLVVDNLLTWFTEGRALTPVPETAHLRRGN